MEQTLTLSNDPITQTIDINQLDGSDDISIESVEEMQSITVDQSEHAYTIDVKMVQDNLCDIPIEPTEHTQSIPVNPDVEFLRGYSPTIDVEKAQNGHYVTVTKADGCETFFIPDGIDVTPEQIDKSVNDYLTEHPVEIDVADKVAEGDPRPVSSAAVHVELGNIDAILKTI